MILAKKEAEKTVESECLSPASEEKRIDLPTAYSGPHALGSLLCDSIGEALTDLLGTRAREAVCDYMKREHSIARNEIPKHLDILFTLFEHNFGARAKNVIGRSIAKKVYAKLDWAFEPIPNFEFADYLERIKTRITREELNKLGRPAPAKQPELDLIIS